MSEKIAKKDLISYSMLALPLAFAGIPLYIHAPDFYATTYGVSVSTLGFTLLGLRFLDALQEPVIGIFSDRHANYRPVIMVVAAFLLAASFALLFFPFLGFPVLWFGLFTFLATAAFSVLTINLNTLGGLWSQDKNQKTIIAGYREAFGLVGLITAVIVPSVLQNVIAKERAFWVVSIMLIVLISIGLLFYWRWQKNHQHTNISHNSLLQEKIQFATLFLPLKETKKFFFIYGISIFASSIPAVLVLFFIRDRLNLEQYTGLFLLLYFAAGALGIPAWQNLSCRFGKHKAWLAAMLLAVVSFVWAYFLTFGDFWQYAVLCVLSGVAFGAELVLPASMLADHIQQHKKEAHASLHFSALALLSKLSLALAAAFSLPFLGMLGFVPAAQNDETALQGLSVFYAVIPCAIKVLAIFLLWSLNNEQNIRNFHRSNSYV